MTKNPKTSQTYFFCTDGETKSFLSFLASNGVRLLKERTSEKKIEDIDLSMEIPGKIYLCPESQVENIKFRKVSESLYVVDESISPTIELDRPMNRKNGISRGRVYIRFGFDGRNGWINHDQELTDLHKKVLNYFKRELFTKERAYLGYVSHEALSYRDSGGTLSQF